MHRVLAVVLALHPLLGCSAQSPEEDALPGPDAGAGGGSTGDPGDPEQKPHLSIDELNASTPYLTVPVTGSGPERGTVIVETTTDSVATDISADGSFCIDVELQQGVMNTLWFKAMDQNGVYSDEVEVTIMQEGDPPDGDNEEEPQSEMRNIARLGEVSMNLHGGDQDPQMMNDGDPTTLVEVENAFWADNDHVRIALTDQAPLHHMRVRSAEDCKIRHYHVLITDAADPGDPPAHYNLGYADTPWQEIAEITEGTGDDVIDPPFQSQPVISHVALLTRGGCSGTWDPENFKIQEIQAFTEEQLVPTGPDGSDAPTCASGGLQ